MGESHPSYDALADLALDDLDETDAWLLEHLSGCVSCRGRYHDVAATVEQVLPAAPRIEPPPGFDHAVLTAMGMTPGAPTRRRPPLLRRFRLGIAAVVLGAVVGVAGALAWSASDEPPAAPTGLATATLDTPDGDAVGSVTPSWLEGEPVLVVRVDQGVVGARYECLLVLADGRTRAVGSWVMESPEATWVVPAPANGVDAVRLVTGAGQVWSSAHLGA